MVERIRGCRFSSATPGVVPLKTGPRISSNPLCGGSIEKSISCMPRFSATAPASSRLSVDVWREGMRTPITFRAPNASHAMAAVNAESTPPDIPMTTFSKPCLRM